MKLTVIMVLKTQEKYQSWTRKYLFIPPESLFSRGDGTQTLPKGVRVNRKVPGQRVVVLFDLSVPPPEDGWVPTRPTTP